MNDLRAAMTIAAAIGWLLGTYQDASYWWVLIFIPCYLAGTYLYDAAKLAARKASK